MDFNRFSLSNGVKVGESLVLACANLDTGIIAIVFFMVYPFKNKLIIIGLLIRHGNLF
jgi:hypothetical protein